MRTGGLGQAHDVVGDALAGVDLVDGVLTDGRIGYGSGPDEIKFFDVRDGLGIRLLQNAGVRVCLLSGRASPANRRRAEELRLDAVVEGATDKAAGLPTSFATGPMMWWRPWRLVAALSLGLACGTKWSGLYFFAAFGLMTVFWDIGARRAAGARHWIVAGIGSGFADLVTFNRRVGAPDLSTLWIAAMPPELASLIVCVSGLLAPADNRPEHGAPVPVRRPGASTSLLAADSGWQCGGTSWATSAEVKPRPPSSRYRASASSRRTDRPFISTRKIVAMLADPPWAWQSRTLPHSSR